MSLFSESESDDAGLPFSADNSAKIGEEVNKKSDEESLTRYVCSSIYLAYHLIGIVLFSSSVEVIPAPIPKRLTILKSEVQFH